MATTEWPRSMSNATTLEPSRPAAPVTATRTNGSSPGSGRTLRMRSPVADRPVLEPGDRKIGALVRELGRQVFVDVDTEAGAITRLQVPVRQRPLVREQLMSRRRVLGVFLNGGVVGGNAKVNGRRHRYGRAAGKADLNIASLYSYLGQMDAATDAIGRAMKRLSGPERLAQLPKLLTHLDRKSTRLNS